MERLRLAYNCLKTFNFSHFLVLALMVKALVSDISYATFLLTVPVLAYEAYKLYLKSKQPDPVRISAEVQKEVDQMKAKLNALSMEKSVKPTPTRYF